MAHTVTITTLQHAGNGHRSIYHIGLISDGVSAELTDRLVVDPVVDLGLTADARLAIEWVGYNFIGFDATLHYDSGLPTDNIAWCLGRDNAASTFNTEIGIKDQSGIGTGTGKLEIDTFGFSSAGSQGTIMLMVRNS